VTKQRDLTVIVVRGTMQSTWNFRFPRFVLPILTVVFVAAISVAAISIHSWYVERQGAMVLYDEISAKDEMIGEQQAAIRDLAEKTQQAQPLLQELQELHKQLQDLLDKNRATLEQGDTSSTAGAAEVQTAANHSGQGGSWQPDVITISKVLPPEVQAYVLGRPSTRAVAVASRSAVAFTRERQSSLDLARATSNLLDQQLKLAEELKAALAADQDQVNNRLDYLAHLPQGSPVRGYTVTSEYGWRWSPLGRGRDFHPGIDLAVPYGTPVRATADGVVEVAGYYTRWYGVSVLINHGYGLQTLYAHNQWNLAVKPGQKVTRGQVIGYVGLTGDTTGPHTHYEVRVNGRTVDPWAYIK
jgi:murein DD-endopeptidase MepM/ murein hydrolase activator NlpD